MNQRIDLDRLELVNWILIKNEPFPSEVRDGVLVESGVELFDQIVEGRGA